MSKIFAKAILLVCMLAIATTAFAQRGGRMIASNLRDGRDVRAAFRDIVSPASKSTVKVVCGGRDCALGTIVSSDGWIVTKYSELRDKIVCKTSDGKSYPATLIGSEPKYDLALLKVDATGLTPADWVDNAFKPDVGQLVATASSTGEIPQAIGVVSTPRREIPHRPGVLGIRLEEGDGAAKIVQVSADSAAQQAGLKPGDIVLRVDKTSVRSRENLVATIQGYQPSDIIDLVIKRGDEERTFTITLRGDSAENRAVRMNAMGSQLSSRAADFPSVIQHDSTIRSVDCGGPLVDLSGKVIGVNIARAGRTESYAIPADRVQLLVNDLKTGKFLPSRPLPGAVVKKTEEVKTEKATDEKKADESKSRDTSTE